MKVISINDLAIKAKPKEPFKVMTSLLSLEVIVVDDFLLKYSEFHPKKDAFSSKL